MGGGWVRSHMNPSCLQSSALQLFGGTCGSSQVPCAHMCFLSCACRASARRYGQPPSCSASHCSGCTACRHQTLTSTARSHVTRHQPWSVLLCDCVFACACSSLLQAGIRLQPSCAYECMAWCENQRHVLWQCRVGNPLIKPLG